MSTASSAVSKATTSAQRKRDGRNAVVGILSTIERELKETFYAAKAVNELQIFALTGKETNYFNSKLFSKDGTKITDFNGGFVSFTKKGEKFNVSNPTHRQLYVDYVLKLNVPSVSGEEMVQWNATPDNLAKYMDSGINAISGAPTKTKILNTITSKSDADKSKVASFLKLLEVISTLIETAGDNDTIARYEDLVREIYPKIKWDTWDEFLTKVKSLDLKDENGDIVSVDISDYENLSTYANYGNSVRIMLSKRTKPLISYFVNKGTALTLPGRYSEKFVNGMKNLLERGYFADIGTNEYKEIAKLTLFKSRSLGGGYSGSHIINKLLSRAFARSIEVADARDARNILLSKTNTERGGNAEGSDKPNTLDSYQSIAGIAMAYNLSFDDNFSFLYTDTEKAEDVKHTDITSFVSDFLLRDEVKTLEDVSKMINVDYMNEIGYEKDSDFRYLFKSSPRNRYLNAVLTSLYIHKERGQGFTSKNVYDVAESIFDDEQQYAEELFSTTTADQQRDQILADRIVEAAVTSYIEDEIVRKDLDTDKSTADLLTETKKNFIKFVTTDRKYVEIYNTVKNEYNEELVSSGSKKRLIPDLK